MRILINNTQQFLKLIGMRIILVRPEHELNIGAVARAMKNFGFYELALVNPRHKPAEIARMYAKHAQEILENVEIYKTLEMATSGFDLIVGTSGKIDSNKNALRLPITPKEFVEYANEKTAIVFGPEGSGLNEEEIKMCDIMVHIPTSDEYPIMNLSHSVAVILYELFKNKNEHEMIKIANESEKEILLKKISGIVDKYPLKNGEKVKLAFKRIFNRGKISSVETKSILAVVTKVSDDLFKKHKVGKDDYRKKK